MKKMQHPKKHNLKTAVKTKDELQKPQLVTLYKKKPN